RLLATANAFSLELIAITVDTEHASWTDAEAPVKMQKEELQRIVGGLSRARGASKPGTSSNVEQIEKELHRLGDPEIAQFLTRFFKTGPGEYGEGDRFLGIRGRNLRKPATKPRSL